ncbi:(2Fe-2S)-binding protein [Calidifontibacter terrae]
MIAQSGPGALSAWGPFFALEDLRDPPRAPWVAFTDFLHDPAAIHERVEVVRALLATGAGRPVEQVEPQVAASVVHLGLVARIISPFLALSTVDSPVVPVPADLWWQPTPHSGFPLGVRDLAAVPAVEDAQEWAARVVNGLLHPLAQALGGSPKVLWGNTASAINGTVAAIRATRADLAEPLRVRAELLIAALPGDTSTGAVGSADFRRRSCCLIYRVADGPAAAICGDCVLHDR